MIRIGTNRRIGNAGILLAVALAASSLFSGRAGSANATDAIAGTQAVYGQIPPDQIEHLSTGERIKSAAASGSMMAIWETLEHGERVECTDCIPAVEPLIYDATPRTREIAAWWLRRRVFGVWGPGEVYERTLLALANDPNPSRRALAAEAVGEFLAAPGGDALAAAIERDGDPNVRAAAAKALGRLNSDGKGALSRALGDVDSRVKVAALRSAGRLNAFQDLAAVTRLTADPDARVRRGAVEVVGARRAAEGVSSLLGLAKSDPDPNVRNAACHALGALHDPSARPVLEEVARTDADGLVRDQATIALRRL